MPKIIKRNWHVLSWRIFFACCLVALNSWALASFQVSAPSSSVQGTNNSLTVAVSFSKPTETKSVTTEDKVVSSTDKLTPPESTPIEKQPTPQQQVIKPQKKVAQPVLKASKPEPVKPKEIAQKNMPAKKQPREQQIKPQPKKTERLAENRNDHQPEPITAAFKTAVDKTAHGVNKTVRLSKPVFAMPPTPPRYPKLARKRGQQGTVWLEIWLDNTGQQSRLEIAKSSGLASLDKSALKAVSSWKFKPYVDENSGIRLASRVQIPVEFSLQ